MKKKLAAKLRVNLKEEDVVVARRLPTRGNTAPIVANFIRAETKPLAMKAIK